MGVISFFRNTEGRFGWSFAGFLLGTVSLLFAGYIYYFSREEQKTQLRVIIEDEVNLVQVKEEIPRLRIFYDAENIIEAKREIKLLRLKVENAGATVLQGFYDQNQPFGLRFEKSVILGCGILDSNSDYLRNNLLIPAARQPIAGSSNALDQTSFMEFKKVIFEKGKFARLKIFLIQEKGIPMTTVAVIGKVSGMETIPVLREDQKELSRVNKVHEPFWLEVAIGGLAGIMPTLLGFAVSQQFRDRRRRKRNVAKFISMQKSLSEEQKKILDYYGDFLPYQHRRLIQEILHGAEVLDLSEFVKNRMEFIERVPRFFFRLPFFFFHPLIFRRHLSFLSPSLLPQVFQREGVSLRLNPANKDFVLSFLRCCGDLNEG